MPYVGGGVVSSVIMALEMAGIRLITPYFGNSLNTWAVVISVILASLGLGYGVSDRLKWNIRGLLLVSGVYIATITFFRYQLIAAILSIPHINLFTQSIIACIVLFVVPNICLAAICPMFAAQVIHSVARAGRSIGVFNMVCTIGSIMGTLLGPLLCIPLMGISTTLFIIAGVCIVLAGVMNSSKMRTSAYIVLLVITISIAFHHSFEKYLSKKGYVVWDTAYATNFIYQDKKATFLITGVFGYESSTTQKRATYLPHLDSMIRNLITTCPKKALVLGGGTLNISSFLENVFDGVHVTSVDIDDKLVEIARTYFQFTKTTSHSLITQDGRVYLNNAKESSFDMIVNDAYKDVLPPFHLTTQEAVQQEYRALSANGVLVTNIPSAVVGKKSWLVNASYATISSVFPHTYIIPLDRTIQKDMLQSLIIVSFKKMRPEDKLKIMSMGGYTPSSHPSMILTDDNAPIEYNLLPVTAGDSHYNWSRYFVRQVDTMMRGYIRSML